jgi:hypothetical protein
MRLSAEFAIETGWGIARHRHRGPTGAAMSQGKLLNTEAGASGQQSNQLFGQVDPAVNSMIQNPGYDTATQNAIVGSSVGAASAPFASAQDTATRTAAADRNSAGVDTTLDALAREQSAADASAANSAQIEIANNKQQQEQQGIEDAANLFGTTQGTMRGLYGSSVPLFGQQQRSSLPGILGGAAGAIGSVFG